MSEQEVEDLRAFARHVALFRGSWKSLDLRVAWTRVGDADVCLFLHGLLSTQPPEALPPDPPDPSTGRFRARRIRRHASALSRLLRGFAECEIRLPGRRLVIGRPGNDGSISTGCSLYEAVLPSTGEGTTPPARPPSVRVYGSLARVSDLSRHFINDQELVNAWQVLPHPYRDERDFYERYLQYPCDQTPDLYGVVGLLAPIPVDFGPKTGFSGDEVAVTVVAEGDMDVESIHVGGVVERPTGTEPLPVIRWPRDGWQLDGSRRLATRHLPVRDALSATLFLRVGEVLIGRRDLRHPSPYPSRVPLLLHEYIDRGYSRLKEWLAGNGKNAGETFERAVAWLLHLDGWCSAHYGVKCVDEEIDVVGLLPESRVVLACECTTGDIADKFATLHRRVQALSARLRSHRVVPAVATPRARGDLNQTALTDAHENGIAVLAQEDLQVGLEAVLRNGPAGQLLVVAEGGGSARLAGPGFAFDAIGGLPTLA